jgi:hypothetical protein
MKTSERLSQLQKELLDLKTLALRKEEEISVFVYDIISSISEALHPVTSVRVARADINNPEILLSGKCIYEERYEKMFTVNHSDFDDVNVLISSIKSAMVPEIDEVKKSFKFEHERFQKKLIRAGLTLEDILK